MKSYLKLEGNTSSKSLTEKNISPSELKSKVLKIYGKIMLGNSPNGNSSVKLARVHETDDRNLPTQSRENNAGIVKRPPIYSTQGGKRHGVAVKKPKIYEKEFWKLS